MAARPTFATGPMHPNARALPFAIAATCLLGLGLWQETGVTGLDEHWFGFRTVLETRASGAWWIPTLDGEARIRKPPLLYWLMGLSGAAFGDSFFAARLPTLLMAIALALAVRALSRRIWGGSGALAGWITLACFMVATEARRAMLDLPVALLTCLALLAVIEAHRRRRPAWLYAAGCAAAAGTLFKGPVIVIFLGAAALAALATPAIRAQALPSRAWIGPGLAFLVLALIWPLSVWWSVPDALAVLAEDAADRSLGPDWTTLTRVPVALLAVALPFSLVLLAGAARGIVRRGVPGDPRARFLLLWIVLAALPFLLVRPFERYFLPILPALILWTEHLLARVAPGRPSPALLSAAVLVALPTVAFSTLAFWFEERWLAPLIAVSALATAIAFALTGRTFRSVQALAVTLAATLGLVYPALGVNRIDPAALAALARIELAHFGSPYPGVLSMQVGRSVRMFDPDSPDPARRAVPESVVLRVEDLPRFVATAAALDVAPRERLRFRTFHARTQFLRFARADVGWADWQAAFRARDWESLKPEFVVLDLAHAVRPPWPPAGRNP